MLILPPSVRIYLAVEPVDLRRGHDGLGAIVRGQWGDNLFAGHLFVFLGRRRDRCKILFWDRGGLVLYYKRLERGRFRMLRISPTVNTQIGGWDHPRAGFHLADVPADSAPRADRVKAANPKGFGEAEP